MFRQYPYNLHKLQVSEERFTENGFPTAGDSLWVFVTICRNIASGGSGKKTSDEAGTNFKYNYTIVAPRYMADIAENTRIKVTDEEGNIRFEGSVLRFERTQLHCRIWV